MCIKKIGICLNFQQSVKTTKLYWLSEDWHRRSGGERNLRQLLLRSRIRYWPFPSLPFRLLMDFYGLVSRFQRPRENQAMNCWRSSACLSVWVHRWINGLNEICIVCSSLPFSPDLLGFKLHRLSESSDKITGQLLINFINSQQRIHSERLRSNHKLHKTNSCFITVIPTASIF